MRSISKVKYSLLQVLNDNFLPSVIANSYYGNVSPQWVEILFELDSISLFPSYIVQQDDLGNNHMKNWVVSQENTCA